MQAVCCVVFVTAALVQPLVGLPPGESPPQAVRDEGQRGGEQDSGLGGHRILL